MKSICFATSVSLLIVVSLAATTCAFNIVTTTKSRYHYSDKQITPILRNEKKSTEQSVTTGSLLSSSQVKANLFIAGWMTTWLATMQVASAVALADPPSSTAVPTSFVDGPNTVVLAAGAYQPESSYSTMDLSMPSYKIEDTVKVAPDIGGGDGGGGDVGSLLDGTATAKQDPAKEAERQAKIAAKKAEKEAQEMAKAKAYFEKQKAKADKKAEAERIKAKVDAERKAKADAKLAEQEARTAAAAVI